MSSDPRTTAALKALAGVYRDPQRIDRDVSSLITTSLGRYLTPIVDSLVSNDGSISTVLCLRGTIGISFRGAEYQQLVDIYLPPNYPTRPPSVFVRLATPLMYYKENHPHVGRDGQVYLPYLHEWSNTNHNLLELIISLSSVFSADPPVFTRAAPQPIVAAPKPQEYFRTYQTVSEREAILQVQEQIALDESRLQAEALAEERRRQELQEHLALEESRLQAEALAKERRRQEEEKLRLEREFQAEVQREQQQYLDLKNKVQKKLHDYLADFSQETLRLVVEHRSDHATLLQRRQQFDTKQSWWKSTERTLEEQHHIVEETTETLSKRLQEWKEEEDAKDATKPPSVDDLVRPVTTIDRQLLDASAENASYSDALYFLDLALHHRKISLPVHLKEVRAVAKQQFFARALLNKLQQYQEQQNQPTSMY
jgi:ESCRT-I complex subunit TSG101